jgi:hypothetical protein
MGEHLLVKPVVLPDNLRSPLSSERITGEFDGSIPNTVIVRLLKMPIRALRRGHSSADCDEDVSVLENIGLEYPGIQRSELPDLFSIGRDLDQSAALTRVLLAIALYADERVPWVRLTLGSSRASTGVLYQRLNAEKR